jgi:hypothetical protein
MNILHIIKIVREVKILLKHQSKADPLIYSDILADEQGVIELEEMKVDNRKLFF